MLNLGRTGVAGPENRLPASLLSWMKPQGEPSATLEKTGKSRLGGGDSTSKNGTKKKNTVLSTRRGGEGANDRTTAGMNHEYFHQGFKGKNDGYSY